MNRMESDWDERKKNKPEKYYSKDDILLKIESSKKFETFK